MRLRLDQPKQVRKGQGAQGTRMLDVCTLLGGPRFENAMNAADTAWRRPPRPPRPRSLASSILPALTIFLTAILQISASNSLHEHENRNSDLHCNKTLVSGEHLAVLPTHKDPPLPQRHTRQLSAARPNTSRTLLDSPPRYTPDHSSRNIFHDIACLLAATRSRATHRRSNFSSTLLQRHHTRSQLHRPTRSANDSTKSKILSTPTIRCSYSSLPSSPSNDTPGGPRRPSRACRVCPGVR